MYLTENAPAVPARMRSELRDFVSDGFLTLAAEPLQRAQTKVYYDCMRQHYYKHNWIAFFDMDEYLAIVERCAPPQDPPCSCSAVLLQRSHRQRSHGGVSVALAQAMQPRRGSLPDCPCICGIHSGGCDRTCEIVYGVWPLCRTRRYVATDD